MSVTITGISPGRGREGDTLTVSGSGFGTDSTKLRVLVDGQPADIGATVTDTSLTATVPAMSNRDQFVGVTVVRMDDPQAYNQDTMAWWSKPTLAEMRGIRIPGQVPGPAESPSVEAPMQAQAKAYERIASLAEWWAMELLTTKGDLLITQSSAPQRLPCGPDGTILEANSSESLGKRWVPPPHYVTLRWARLVAAGEATLLPMVANGDANTGTTTIGETAAPCDGTIERVWCLCEEEGSTDTLDQVAVYVNGSSVLDSGTGLGKSQGQRYDASPSIVVRTGDRIEVRAKKLGTAALMRLTAGLRVLERRVDPRDAMTAVDVFTAAVTYARDPGADAAVVGDAITASAT